MIFSCWGAVAAVLESRAGVNQLLIDLGGKQEKALNYEDLTGPVEIGDRVLVNTTAVNLGLGTGGFHVVMANDRNQAHSPLEPGHIVKLRYTPSQTAVLAAEEQDSPYHEELSRFQSLAGTPVVVTTLHSTLPSIAAAAKSLTGPGTRVVFVMTDGAALPMALSRLVPELKEKGLIDATVTSGHAFGGDLETVNIYTGLMAARQVLKADVVIAGMGPGIVGTGTELGFSGVEQGEIINAVHILGGRPVACLRVSFADPRPRHRGISHHSLTVLSRIALVPAFVAVPELPEPEEQYIRKQVDEHELGTKHKLVWATGRLGIEGLAAAGVKVTTMGRSPAQDPAFFLAAGAAGTVAGRLLAEPLT